MQNKFSRRDLLKVTGLGLGAVALRPVNKFLSDDGQSYLNRGEGNWVGLPLPQFPEGENLGRILGKVDVFSRPTTDPSAASITNTLYDDNMVVWGREVVGNAIGRTNQRFVETDQGFIYSPFVQPASNKPNNPITALPEGSSGFWAEVTIPYVDLLLDGPPISSWVKSLIAYNFPPRLYYSQVVWIDQIRAETSGQVYYRFNESPGHGYGPGDLFWADGAAFRVLTDEDVSPINPEVDPASKHINIDLDYQTLSCLEAGREVYFCRVSTGAVYLASGEFTDEWKTPVGDLNTHWKIISLNMSAGTVGAGYSTPAVPWATFIHGDGVAIHGAFWHNDFGERRSHGCVNLRPEDAKWVFRWTTPIITLQQSEQRMTWPDHGTVVSVTERET